MCLTDIKHSFLLNNEHSKARSPGIKIFRLEVELHLLLGGANKKKVVFTPPFNLRFPILSFTAEWAEKYWEQADYKNNYNNDPNNTASTKKSPVFIIFCHTYHSIF